MAKKSTKAVAASSEEKAVTVKKTASTKTAKAAPTTEEVVEEVIEETPKAKKKATKTASATAPKAKVAKVTKKTASASVSKVIETDTNDDEGSDNETSEIEIKPAYDLENMPVFYRMQYNRLIELRSALSDSLSEATREATRLQEGGDVGGMHMGDAGSDAYDRDFALSMLTKEQNSIYEVNDAIQRIERGVYGICEISGKQIPEERLEALPYTRYTRETQEQIERNKIGGKFVRPAVKSVFGLEDSDDDDDQEEGGPGNNDSSLDFAKD